MAKATLHDPRRGVTPKPKRGGKANLSPRVPAVRKIPRLGESVKKTLPDGRVRWEWVHTDFATPAVVEALERAGWKRRRFDEAADRPDLEIGLGPSELDGRAPVLASQA